MFSLIEKVHAGYATQGEASTVLTSPIKASTLPEIFGLVINIILGVGWALVFVMLALGFVQYVMSRGEKTAVESAQKWLTYAVIGGVGLFFVIVLRSIIPALVGADAGFGNIAI